MLLPLELVKASLSHLPDLQALARQTFFEAFSPANTKENTSLYLEENFSLEKLTLELSARDSEFYLARLNHLFIGYFKINFNKAQTELKESNGIEIERIYVLKEYHGKQAGQILFNKAMEIAKHRKMDYVWLGVWEKNQRALRFYEKNGFVPFSTHIFKFGKAEQTDILMKLVLKS